jgi:putative ABC transport system permease protein
VTIGELSFGMASSLLILGYISAELSYDQFFTKKDRIYRMVWEYGSDSYTTRLQPVLGERIKNGLTEIEELLSRRIQCWESFDTSE